MTLPGNPQVATSQDYEVGRLLALNVEPEAGQPPSRLRVLVKKLQEPWRLSSGMVVEPQPAGAIDPQSSTAFLKMFDRRHASQLRRDNGIEPWTNGIEDSCVEFARSSRADEFLYKLRHDTGLVDSEGENWDDAENEGYLANELLRMYEAEKTAYTALRDYQGKLVPRFLAGVNLDITPPEVEHHAKPSALYQTKGILLEYLEGFGLATLEKHAPQSSWQDIVDQAVNIVHVLSDNNILNADVRPDNFVIVPCGEKRYRVFMIDLAQCRLRREDESDMDWGRAKWTQDEEGAVGFVMKHRLGKLGFELVFNHSQRYLEFAEREE